MNKSLKLSISNMKNEIKSILQQNILSMYVYGSCVLNDFQLGWSDIDILVLTKNRLKDEEVNKLLSLRQEMLKKEPKNKYYRSFEGAILSINSFLNLTKENIVYWGTKGEKVRDNYVLDSFSMQELIEHGLLICGEDIRNKLVKPSFKDLKSDIKYHYETIRKHGKKFIFVWLVFRYFKMYLHFKNR